MQAPTLMTDPRDIYNNIRLISESFNADKQIRSPTLFQNMSRKPKNELIVASDHLNKNFSFPIRRTVTNKTHTKCVLFDVLQSIIKL